MAVSARARSTPAPIHSQLGIRAHSRGAGGTRRILLARGFVTTDSPYGALRFGVPRHALRFYFPALWPEAEQDEGFLSGAVGVPVVKAKRRG